ncbi:MAG TPA: FesM, partial [Chloroflexota bacterium]|nr:FesM [Chloroflexota bacterium]
PSTDFARRPDLAAMAVVLVAAAFMNAFGMVAPVYGVERWIAGSLGTESRLLVLAVLFGFGLVVVPALLVSIAGWIGRYLSGSRRPVIQVASYYSFALVPLGFGMWLSHYSFHFLTGALTVLPVVQSLLSDLGLPILGSPQWGLGPVVPFSWLMPVELLFLEGGLLVSLVAGYRMAAREEGDSGKTLIAFLPWALLCLALFAAGVWLMQQPMEMRGTFVGG